MADLGSIASLFVSYDEPIRSVQGPGLLPTEDYQFNISPRFSSISHQPPDYWLSFVHHHSLHIYKSLFPPACFHKIAHDFP